jgi:hypothetical protein
VSNINFDIWILFCGRGVSINISWKIYQGRQSSCPLGVSIKDIVRVFNWFKCLGGFPHLKPTAGCQISTLICSEVLCSGIFPTLQMTTSFPEFSYWWVIRTISLIETPSGQELCRPWYIFQEIFIETPLPQNKIQISKLIFDTLLWAWGAEIHPDT